MMKELQMMAAELHDAREVSPAVCLRACCPLPARDGAVNIDLSFTLATLCLVLTIYARYGMCGTDGACHAPSGSSAQRRARLPPRRSSPACR